MVGTREMHAELEFVRVETKWSQTEEKSADNSVIIEKNREIGHDAFSRMQSMRDSKGNPPKSSTGFSRQITVVDGLLRLCGEFSNGDQRDL
jgi:hypothetical protein